MKLAYRAFDNTGRPMADTLEAANIAEATESLRRRGLFVTEIAEEGAGGAPKVKAEARKKNKSPGGKQMKNLALFSRQLHMLVASGTPLVEALTSLERQSKDVKWRSVIVAVRERVEEGVSLSDAMSAYPQAFDAVCLSLVSVGESGGLLPEMLDRISVLTRKRLQVRSSVIGAMIYPILLLTVAGSVLGMMFVFVIPRFATLFQTLDVPLPGSTKALIGISNFCKVYWWALLLGIGGAVAGARAWLSTTAGTRAWHTALLRTPKLGTIVRSFGTARIARLLGVLLDSHVPLLDALNLVGRAMSNVHYAEMIATAEDAVTHGEPLSAAFTDEKLIDSSVYQAVHSGEQAGRVGAVLTSVADYLDEDNDVVVRSLTTLIEPLILIFMGGIVALVAMSMFMPMFDLTAMT